MPGERFSPRQWVEPTSAFGTEEVSTWREPHSADEVLELMHAAWLHHASLVVNDELAARRMPVEAFGRDLGLSDSQTRRLRRKLNGEFPAQLQDVLLWAAVLNRPDALLSPQGLEDLVPDQQPVAELDRAIHRDGDGLLPEGPLVVPDVQPRQHPTL